MLREEEQLGKLRTGHMDTSLGALISHL
jgi:hypothetical protein